MQRGRANTHTMWRRRDNSDYNHAISLFCRNIGLIIADDGK